MLLSLASCGHGNDGNDTGLKPPPVTVLVAPVTQKTVPIVNDYVGTTGAITAVDVRARVTGTLESAPFKEGSLVHKGELIFTIQPTQYEAAVSSAQASLLKGKADLMSAQDTVPIQQAEAVVAQKAAALDRANITVARMTPLAAAKAVPQKDLDNALTSQAEAKADYIGSLAQLHNAKVDQPANIESAKAEILSAQASITNADLNLSYTRITSPVTGLIGFLKYDVGNVISTPNDILDTITTVDPIKVNFSVDENVYLALAGRNRLHRSLLDQPLKLLLANNKTYDYPGRLYTVNPTLDAKTGTIVVEARFPNPDAYLRPGQFARISLTTEERPDAVLIPALAIVRTQGTTTAYVVSPQNEVQLRSLTLGPQYGDQYIVNDGVKPGERVVVQGLQKVQPGMTVTIGK